MSSGSEILIEVPEVGALVGVGVAAFIFGVLLGAVFTGRSRKAVKILKRLESNLAAFPLAYTEDPDPVPSPAEPVDEPAHDGAVDEFDDWAKLDDAADEDPGTPVVDDTLSHDAAEGTDADDPLASFTAAPLADLAELDRAAAERAASADTVHDAADEDNESDGVGAPVTEPVDGFGLTVDVEHADEDVSADGGLTFEEGPGSGFGEMSPEAELLVNPFAATDDELIDDVIEDPDSAAGLDDDQGSGNVDRLAADDGDVLGEGPSGPVPGLDDLTDHDPAAVPTVVTEEQELAQLTGMFPIEVGHDDWDPMNVSSSELLRGRDVKDLQWWQPVSAPQIALPPVATFTVEGKDHDVTAVVVRLRGSVWQMTMRPSDGSDRVDPNLGFVDLSFGDPEFDLAFQVTCANREAALVTLSEPFRRLLLSLSGAWEIELVDDKLILVRAQPYLRRRLRQVWTARTAQLAAGSAFTALSVAEHIPPAAIDRPHYLDLDS